MSVLWLLVPLSLLIALGWVMAYIWSVRNDQLEDLVGPSVRILEESTLSPETRTESAKITKNPQIR